MTPFDNKDLPVLQFEQSARPATPLLNQHRTTASARFEKSEFLTRPRDDAPIRSPSFRASTRNWVAELK